MKKFAFKTTALLTATLLIGLTITSCNTKTTTETSLIENVSQENIKININGDSVALPYIIKIEDKEISTAMFKYYYFNVKTNIDGGDDTYWDSKTDELNALKESTVKYLKNAYVVSKLAIDNGIVLSESEKAEINQKIMDIKAEYDASESVQDFAQALAEKYLTLPIYRDLMYEDAIETKLREILFGEGGALYISSEDAKNKIINEYYCMRQIFVPLDEEGSSENYDNIVKAKEKLDSGTSFDEVLEEYNKDSGMNDNAAGYYFAKGQMYEEIEQAYLNIGVGKYSDIIKTDRGYHIVLRQNTDASHVEKNLDSFISDMQDTEFNEMVNKKAEDIKVEYCENYDKIGISSFS